MYLHHTSKPTYSGPCDLSPKHTVLTPGLSSHLVQVFTCQAVSLGCCQKSLTNLLYLLLYLFLQTGLSTPLDMCVRHNPTHGFPLPPRPDSLSSNP